MLIPFVIYLLVCSKLDWSINWLDWIIFSLLLLRALIRMAYTASVVIEEEELMFKRKKLIEEVAKFPTQPVTPPLPTPSDQPSPPQDRLRDLMSKTYRSIDDPSK